MRTRAQAGFTLLEALMAVLVAAVLVGAAVPSLQSARASAYAGKARSEMLGTIMAARHVVLVAGGGSKGEDQRNLREPVAHAVEQSAVTRGADQRRAPRQLCDLIQAVARIKEHHHKEQRGKW